MRAGTPILTLWRVVLEARTPLSIGTGRGDGVHDVVLATDANGLPTLPASGLAGVLRGAVAGWQGEAAAQRLFGFARGQDGAISRLEVGHGRIHDSRDRPVLDLCPEVVDPLLAPLTTRRPTQRQRVRIGHRGAVADQGLFDRAVLPAGHRFSVELALWSAPGAEDEAAWIDTLFGKGGLRMGAQTRSGLGLLGPVRLHRVRFDLRSADGLRALSALSPALDDTRGLQPAAAAAAAVRGGQRVLSVALAPEAGFRFGDGHRSLLAVPSRKPADDLPKTEPRVVWANGRGRLQNVDEEQPLVPASSVKGALAHRVAFHAHRLQGRWARAEDAAGYDKAEHCDTVRRLFGHAKDDTRDRAAAAAGAPAGQAGLLWVADATIDAACVTAQAQMHNSIDRFTGGVRDGLLFSAENLHAARRGDELLHLELVLDTARAPQVGLQDQDLQALALALDDLCAGRLALGADSAGGQGSFTGRWHWDGDGVAPRLAAAIGALQ